MPIALATLSSHLGCRDVIVFCDNASAVASLIRGTSKSDDALGISELFHVLCLQLGSRVWIEWIDSRSNPSDGLSRDGVQDSWTRAQNWLTTEISGHAFPDLPLDPWYSASCVRHWGSAHRWW